GEEGGAAEAALRDAAHGGNPERVMRARAILRDIEDGIAPSTPQFLIQLLRKYRAASDLDRPRLIRVLRGVGVDGVRIVLRLEEQETNQKVKQQIERILAEAPRLPAALLLTEGKRDEAEAMLAESARTNFFSAQNFVAYWQDQPTSSRKTAALRQVMIDRAWGTQAMLEQIDGDHTNAMHDALTSGEGPLAYWMSAQQGDWSELLHGLLAAKSPGKLKDVALRALAADLAEDQPELDRQAKMILTCPVPPGTDERRSRALALCLAERPGDAVKMLTDAGEFDLAWDLLIPQMQYSRQLALLDRAKGNALQTLRLQVRAAALLHRLGKNREAQDMLAQAIGGNRLVHDPNIAMDLLAAAREMEPIDKVDDLLVETLHSSLLWPAFFQRAGFSDYVVFDYWWRFLSSRQPTAPPLQVIHVLRAIDAGKIPVSELGALADEFEKWSASLQSAEQAAVLQSEAVSWAAAGRPDKQLDAFKRAAAVLPLSNNFMILGRCAEKQQDWSDAAEAYGNAAQCNPADATAAFLHGWALTKLGNAQQGRALMDLAHDLPLADELQRTLLYDAAWQRGLTADADRERDILLAAGNYDSSMFFPFLETMTRRSQLQKNYADAARTLAQSLWALVYTQGGFRESEACVRNPAQLHRLRAMALFAAGRPDEAMVEARRFDQLSPDDSTCQGLLVRAADAAGDQQQADEIFNTSIGRFTKLLADFPNSPDLNNEIAWEEACCRRKLDDAVAHAQRGVELDPQNVAILDTLAEVHYQRKEFQAAIDAMNRCIALDPNDGHFAEQLVRFRLARKTGVVEGPY
ncbi:MAG TPA: hypothetical protein VHY37_07085, partial [Tepidisphaeraceae bacterium]|nr:hypothetical protein [Tepidisphaeraceae bacterium]